jgi:predicted Zn-dependent protease
MRFRMILAEIAICSSLAICQTSQISKTWEPGRSLSGKLDPYVRHIEHNHQRVDPYLGNYLQRLEDRVATAAGVKPDEIRVTSGEEWYGFRLPERVLYLSEGLLVRVSSEGELAGLLAHELAHANQKFQQCALATGYLPVPRSPRASERSATQQAIGYMKASGFDPSAMLDLFSQISYEDRRLTKAIVGEDLLSMRVALDAEPEPAAGYAIDGSEFIRFHASLYGAPAIVVRPRQ